MNGFTFLLLAITLVASAASSAASQEPVGANAIEEVVVTAQKKSQSIEDVPMSISAFSAADIERNALNNLQDYGTRIPNLSFGATGESSSAGLLGIAIRGVVGTGTTGFYIDDTPMPGSLNPLVMDLERIEVLRGPQGTLYGARSMGGTVRLITKVPELHTTDGSVHARVSTTKDGGMGYRADAVVNTPLVADTFALRMLAYGQDQSGFIDRAPSADAPTDFPVQKDIDGRRTYGGRVAGLLSLMNGDLTVLPAFTLEHTRWDGRSWADITAESRTNYRAFNIDEKGKSDWQLASLTVHYAAPYGDFTSSTSYFDSSAKDTEDASEFLSIVFDPDHNPGNGVGLPSFLPGPLWRLDDGRAFAQELRFTSRLSGPLQFTVGGFYQDYDAKVTFPPSQFPAAPAPPMVPNVFSLNQDQEVKEAAAFAEATFNVTKKLALIAGGRYFDNKVQFSTVQGGAFGYPIPFSHDTSETGFTPKLGLQYKLDANRMLYATASKGYRIGGVNVVPDVCAGDLASLGLTESEIAAYDSDSLWNYEAGLRSTWQDRRVVWNLAGYYIDWKDVQQTIGLSCGFHAVVNAGKARIQGFETDFSWAVARGLSANLGVGYTDSRVTDNGGLASLPEGTPVQNAPKWTGSAAVDYDFQIDSVPLYLHADYAYVGESLNARNSAPFYRVRPSYNILNLRGGLAVGRWDVGLFVENVTDEKANLADVPPMAAELWGRPRILVNRPRTIGLEVTAKL